MNFVESLSLFSGLKSSNPSIEESFFPIVPDKFITICSEDHPSKQWDHFQEYLSLIIPILKKHGISIIEIGNNNHSLKGVTSLKGATNANHWSYIVKKTMLHIGPENFVTQLASFFHKPFISFFSNTSPDYSFPVWSKNKDQIAIQANLKSKSPSYSGEEAIKTINTISAEEVASKTLNILGIKNDFNLYDVLCVGSAYHERLIEVVPDFSPTDDFFPKSLLNIRMDYKFNESYIPNFANNRKITIVSEREINIQLLNHIRPAIEALYFKVDKDFSISYLSDLKSQGFPVNLIAKKDIDLPNTRLKFFDWEIHDEISISKKDLDNFEKICDTTRYKSSKSIFSQEGQFSSKCAYDKKIKFHKDQIIIDEESFWEDSEYLKLYNLT
jgi:hypothetical protein